MLCNHHAYPNNLFRGKCVLKGGIKWANDLWKLGFHVAP